MLMNHKWIGLLVVVMIGWSAVCGFAQTSEIKKRMIQRLPIIKALKAQGVIGENNRGYLEFVGSQRPNEDVVVAENKDRKAVYQAIAKQQNVQLQVVEIHRAAQIEKKANPGEWLQDANGKWYQKK